jgi:hypothetical protein
VCYSIFASKIAFSRDWRDWRGYREFSTLAPVTFKQLGGEEKNYAANPDYHLNWRTRDDRNK